MNWLYRLGWWLWPRPEPATYIVEKWVYLVVVVERRPQRPMFDEWLNCKGNRPPKRLKRNRDRRRFRRPPPRYNHPY